jgi:hypothetical protein
MVSTFVFGAAYTLRLSAGLIITDAVTAVNAGIRRLVYMLRQPATLVF